LSSTCDAVHGVTIKRKIGKIQGKASRISKLPDAGNLYDSAREANLCSEKQFDPFSRFDTVPACGRQTDRHLVTANTALYA